MWARSASGRRAAAARSPEQRREAAREAHARGAARDGPEGRGGAEPGGAAGGGGRAEPGGAPGGRQEGGGDPPAQSRGQDDRGYRGRLVISLTEVLRPDWPISIAVPVLSTSNRLSADGENVGYGESGGLRPRW